MSSSPTTWNWLPGAIVPFDWEAFARKHRILYRHHGGLKAVAGPMAFRLTMFAIGQSAWALDEVFDPRWRNVKMRGPLFILGHQRSGTTFLHRLLSRDRAHARSLLLHEMLLPASSVQNALTKLGAWDSRRGGKLGAWFHNKQEDKFSPLDDIHRIRFDEVEEDEFVLWAIYASAMCVNDSPLAVADDKLDELRHFHQWPVERQIRALGWYRACLLKKIQREPSPDPASPPWGISKNPAFSQKIPELLKVFPDARLLLLVRNPLETIPSRLSLIRAIWRHRFPGFTEMSPAQVQTIVADSIRTYLYAEHDIAAVPDERKLIIPYGQLVGNPRKTVQNIYRRFDLPGPDENLAAALAEMKGRKKGYASRHRYSLDEFGLDEQELREKLAPVFSRYAFD